MRYLNSKYSFFIIFIFWILLIMIGFNRSDLLGYAATIIPVLFLALLAN